MGESFPDRRPDREGGRRVNGQGRRALPHGRAFDRLPCHTACLLWQFLCVLPEPHGHGSLRPTFRPRLRIGSVFLTSSPVVPCCCRAWSRAACCIAVGAEACVAAPIIHTVSSNASDSSMRKIISVILSSTPSHIALNSFMPSCLYTVLGSSCA